MSIADEIAKLSRLKDDGVITDSEFQKQKKDILKGQKVSSSSGSFFKSLFIIVALVILMVGFVGWLGSKSANVNSPNLALSEVPKCDSPEANQMLHDAVADNPSKTINTLKLLEVNRITETGYDAARRERSCRANFLTNAGEGLSNYRLFFSEKGGLFVQIDARR